MKKRLTVVVALTLALVLLCGCSLTDSALGNSIGGKLAQFAQRTSEHNPDGLKFSDMRYYRPDTEKLAADVAAVEEALDSGARLKAVEALLDVCMDDYDEFDTMYALANIYNCKDLRDEYYAGEYEWISTESSTVSQLFDEMYYACAGSSLGADLEDDYFWEGFCEDYADPEDSYYNDATVALMQRESELISRYRDLVADPSIVVDGEEVSFYDLLDERSDYTDLEGYYAYLDAWMTYYETYNEPMADIYIELMRVHADMAEEMGFSSAEEMEFVFGFDRDFTPADAAVFIEDIKTYLVPLYVWADRQGLSYGIRYSPLGSEELYADLSGVADSIGRECSEAFSFMDRFELYDIEPSAYKADTSFQTYLSLYDAPFIFLKPEGTTRDLITFVHEFGHYTDAYTNFDEPEAIDLAEVYSQALEFLSLSHMDGILPQPQIDELRTGLVLDSLNTFIQQASFADFESKAHALGPDNLSAEKLNELALQATKDFGYCPEGLEDVMQYFWMDITHLFEYPFYVISYPVSLDVAMQIYELEVGEEGAGLDRYFEMLPRDYDSFMETVTAGGLESPFAEGGLASIAALIADTIGYEEPLAHAA